MRGDCMSDNEGINAANDRQVGGDHYVTKNGAQHWDLFGPDYLIGYATKYMRWRRKGGVEDLEKAIHVIDKLIETITQFNQPRYDSDRVQAWCDGAGLDWTEQRVVRLIMFSTGHNDLIEAQRGIRHLIANATPAVLTPPDPVTVEKFITWTAPSSKPYSEMTDEELEAELVALHKKQQEATSWGAAVGVRGEYIAQIEQEKRRRRQRGVPRFDGPVMKGPMQEAMKAHESMLPRTPEDGGQHAGLAPWQIYLNTLKQWSDGSAVRRETLYRFYKCVARDIYRLEPLVVSHLIPREVQDCYQVTAGGWLLRVDRVPEDLRDAYPRLQREMNAVEYDQSDEQFRHMYNKDLADNKWKLHPQYADAWGRES